MKKEEYWSRFAKNFEELNNYVAGHENINAIRESLRTCALKGKVLELGCGNGTYSKILAETADHVHATDLSDEMVAESALRLESFTNISVEKQNCLELSYDDRIFDAVVMVNLLHVIPEPERAIKESKRVLKKGGELIVISFTADGISFFRKLTMIYRYLKTYGKPPENARVLTVENTTRLLTEEGFEVRDAQLIGATLKSVFAKAVSQ